MILNKSIPVSNKKSALRGSGAITLVEVLLSIVILSVASVFIFRSFFVSLTAINEMSSRLELMQIANNKITEVKQAIKSGHQLKDSALNGTIVRGNTVFRFNIKEDQPIKDVTLHKVEFDFSWNQGSRLKRKNYKVFCYSYPEPENNYGL